MSRRFRICMAKGGRESLRSRYGRSKLTLISSQKKNPKTGFPKASEFCWQSILEFPQHLRMSLIILKISFNPLFSGWTNRKCICRMFSPFLLHHILLFREYSSKDIAIILNFTGKSLHLKICSTFVYSISEYEAYPSHTIFFREYMHLSQSILYIFHCIFTLLNYYLGLSNGSPCCHLPQCFPHNNWCPPWDMGVGGTDGQNESHPSQIYIYDCANMHWETAEKLFCEISNNMF